MSNRIPSNTILKYQKHGGTFSLDFLLVEFQLSPLQLFLGSIDYDYQTLQLFFTAK